ncbi:MAG: hypothetical protein ACTSRG_17825 [Candidatus Helarchaeota archaeon]
MDLFQSVSEFIPFSFTIVIAVLIASIIISFILKIEFFNRFTVIVGVLCAPGIALHELGHLFFATLTGCPIDAVSLFHLGRNKYGEVVGVGGYVKGEFPDSFLANFLVSIGPVILNGIAVSLVIFFMSYLNETLAYYLIFAFTLGSQPSSRDISNIFSPFQKNPSKAWFELLSCFISLIPAWFVGTWNVYSVYEINWLLFIIVYFCSLVTLILCYKMNNYE